MVCRPVELVWLYPWCAPAACALSDYLPNPPVKMVNGKGYENTEQCWTYLGMASQAARYLDMVNSECFIDRRNAAPVDNIDYANTSHAETYIFNELNYSDDTSLPDFPDLPYYEADINSHQRYHLELWCEKSTQDDILRPLAERYKAALQYGLGELSITLALEAIRRFEKSAKPVRIFYISDFDYSGWNMPQSMASKLQYYNLKLDLNLDIKLYPVVLTPEQVRRYNLPATPAKDSLGAIEKRFKERHHVDGFTELDALEALHPGALRRILIGELDRYYDGDLGRRLMIYRDDAQATLDETKEQIYAQHSGDIEELEEEWQAIRDEFAERLASHTEKRRELWYAIRDGLEQNTPDVSDDIPEADYAEEREGALFDSSRSYLEQNDIYQAHKGNGSDDDE